MKTFLVKLTAIKPIHAYIRFQDLRPKSQSRICYFLSAPSNIEFRTKSTWVQFYQAPNLVSTRASNPEEKKIFGELLEPSWNGALSVQDSNNGSALVNDNYRQVISVRKQYQASPEQEQDLNFESGHKRCDVWK